MSIKVYWSCLEEEGLRARKPEPVLKNFYQSDLFDKDTTIQKCPSFLQYYHNVFSLKSIYDYSFTLDEKTGQVQSPLYDQKFFDRHVTVRSIRSKFFSFTTNFIFFTDEKSLKLSLEQPSLDYSKNLDNIIPISGTLDIGKWYRVLDFAFFLKSGNSFNIKEGDPFYQLRFHTDEKIEFVRFFENDDLVKYKKLVLDSKNSHTSTKSLEYYYNIFNIKRQILKNIKENLE